VERKKHETQKSFKMTRTVFLAMFFVGLAHGLTIMPPTTKIAEHLPLAKQAMEYFDKSSDPFHAVQTSIDLLVEAGFEELEDIRPYAGKILPGMHEIKVLFSLCCG
jgi:hypothetical protein